MNKEIDTIIIKSLFEKCDKFVRADEIKATGNFPYFQAISKSDGPVVRMDGRDIIMAGSNNYLGLSTHPYVVESAEKALKKYGTSCSGSRYLTGTIDLHNELEYRLAKFMQKELALVYSTGYQTSQGVIATLVGRGDYIISDKDNHASIVVGTLIAKSLGAKLLRYNHLDMNDLERQLQKIPTNAGKLIVTDGVFSGDGSLAPIDKIYGLAEKYQAQTLVDDAHAIGVIGETGRGSSSYFDKDIDLTICTFSKALASLGGFVVGEKRVIDYLKHNAPAFIFSASPTPSSVAAALASLDILESQAELVDQVQYNTRRIRKALQDLGFDVPNGKSAIVPIYIEGESSSFVFWKALFDAGIFVNVFIPPASPKGKSMLRNSFMASHKEEHLDKIISAYAKVGKDLGII